MGSAARGSVVSRCNVVNEDCSGASVDPRDHVRSKCFACGLPVCKACSRMRTWYRWRRRRVCDHCHDQDVRMQERRRGRSPAVGGR